MSGRIVDIVVAWALPLQNDYIRHPVCVIMVRLSRRRYIALRIHLDTPVGKGLLIKLIRDRTRELDRETFERIKPWLSYFHQGWAIVKAGHRGQADLISIMEDINRKERERGGLRIEVLGVSGTIRKAFYKYIPEGVRKERHYHEDRKA